MIRSMTGFGRAERVSGEWLLHAEARSVNHKDLKVSFRIPDAFRSGEIELQKQLEKRLRRGHVNFSLECQPRAGASAVLVDSQRVSEYLYALREVAAELDVPFNVDLASLLRLPDTLRSMATDEALQRSLWPDVLAVADEALEGLIAMRQAEGANLRVQLEEICRTVEDLVHTIEKDQATFVVAYRDRLRERIGRLLEGTEAQVEEHSLAREVAYYADRCDISEELARLRSHVKQFREALEADGEPVGRKMEFLGQEMLREAGTIGAKVPSEQQVPQVLELRTQIDRLREQVRNVE
jgi:uncharacterized protein (TIGR00255 family)